MVSSDRKIIKSLKREELNEKSSNNISFSSNKSFYEKLDIEAKRDIIFLIKSGYDKKTIIIFLIILNIFIIFPTSHFSNFFNLNMYILFIYIYKAIKC